MAQLVKNLPAMWETWLQSLGWEDPLEKAMVTLSNILAWRISWTGEADWLHTVHEVTKSQTQLSMLTCTHTLRDTQRDMMLLRTPNLWHLVTYKCDYVRKRPAPWCTSISELSVK